MSRYVGHIFALAGNNIATEISFFRLQRRHINFLYILDNRTCTSYSYLTTVDECSLSFLDHCLNSLCADSTARGVLLGGAGRQRENENGQVRLCLSSFRFPGHPFHARRCFYNNIQSAIAIISLLSPETSGKFESSNLISNASTKQLIDQDNISSFV